MTTKYTKDELIKVILENQKMITGQVAKNTEAFQGVTDALKTINDNNIFHMNKEDGRDLTITKLVAGNEKFYKIVSLILVALVAALIILAGAEKALRFLSPL